MADCRTCGNSTSRIKTHFEGRDGKPLKSPVDSCPMCAPDEFPQEPVLAPSDRRFYANWEVNPNEYDTLVYDDGEYVPKVKDWAKGEFEQTLIDAPVATAEEEAEKEKKRAFARERNRKPLTRAEVEKVDTYYREQFELVDRMIRAEEAGLVLPN